MLICEKNEQSKMKIIDCKSISKSMAPKTIDKKNLVVSFFVKGSYPETEKTNESYIKSLKKALPFVKEFKVITIPKYILQDRIWTRKFVQEYLNRDSRNTRHIGIMVGFKKIEQQLFQKAFDGIQMTFVDTYKSPSVVSAAMCAIDSVCDDNKKSNSDLLIIGRSDNANSFAEIAIKNFNTVTMCHSKTSNLENYCKGADVIVSFSGSPNLIKGDMVKEGTVIISVGCSFVDGKIVGDIDIESMKDKDVWVTTTPGGIGALTTGITALEIFNK